MTAMTWIRSAIVLLVLAAISGCASGGPPPPRGSHVPRTRCLSDPNETGARPLFFLFCVETP
jgi:hypothetical protein